MLRNTFLHIPGVGPATEQYLWTRGILSWEHYLDNREFMTLPYHLRPLLDWHLEHSVESLSCGDAAYFETMLPGSEHWRLYREFQDSVAFLDIETTGLYMGCDSITVIGLYDGKETKVFVKGRNLDDFPEEIKRYSLLVTYNGRRFDLPFIRHLFGEFPSRQGHLDLRYPLLNLGYRGGLKSMERQLGIEREGALKDIDGYMAILLWRAHEAGNDRALETLIRYNLEDVVNLRYLADVTYNLAISNLPIDVEPMSTRPKYELKLPFDEKLVRRLRPWS